MMKIGVIADDLTGATDIASFLVANGLPTVQMNGVPVEDAPAACEAVVIGLKTRSCPAPDAIALSLSALSWLQEQGCRQIYFKYCSTFDSTAQGNIGPVTRALMTALDTPFTVFSPALPVNGRTVYQGYLFVMDQLLAESGMRHHPLNPMSDSYLPRLVEGQATGRCGVVSAQTLDQGAAATRAALQRLQDEGYSWAVLDALNERHLEIQGEALRDLTLVTGGSGLAIGLARQWARAGASADSAASGYPQPGRAVVLSGSCSEMTNRQVGHYAQLAPAQAVEVALCLKDREAYASELAAWALAQTSELAPIIYATASAQALKEIQAQFGAARASEAVEALFASLAVKLAEGEFRRFIVAGGETAGVVCQQLGITGFHIGPTISPGVPWVKALNQPVSLALKSGNFGDEAFFSRAQQEFPV
ncbi:MAG: 3-oxo-tetronate kinase [Scandinavium sp.]|uniref:3-oxo-tetronate kinase n=1 Tax=Scandinavium sp. TaxID=2830653 RepID=UPI003F3E614A